MSTVSILPSDSIGKGFIPDEFIPGGKDEYYLRNIQNPEQEGRWRHLEPDEIESLLQNGNTCNNWSDISVTDQFDTDLVRNTEFCGLVRIGNIRNIVLEHHDLRVPAGITNSVIISCDIGDDTAIHDVRYLSHFIIGDRCVLFNINEMHTTSHSKFGNGIIMEGEPEDIRIWLNLINEAGSRRILPFNGIITADAYLWAKYRDDTVLLDKLKDITQNSFDSRRGSYGTVGDQCVIRNSLVLKDVLIGSHCYIKGINKLKNLTINSSESEPTMIGEGVELVNGIIGFGCHVFYGCKAVRFILGDNSNLKYGARLIHSFLGDNSTVSCCEVLNNLIFPAHEQHHNNSFLIASLVMGQSNMAAGATIGSNHNSRANDNEIQAGRGFWPGLCTSIKHSCRFASYVLLSKADYPSELDIPLPFSLISNNAMLNQLEVMPAFWWLYNMYALERNSSKFHMRDGRKRKIQNIEFDYLAPDTAEEMFHARRLLEIWTARAGLLCKLEPADTKTDEELAAIGREILYGSSATVDALEILGENMEKSNRDVVIKKAYKAYHAYGDMLHYYAINNLLEYLNTNQDVDYSALCEDLACDRIHEWVNLGGQIISGKDVALIRSDIRSGKLSDWDEIHRRYDTLQEAYPFEKQKHSFATLCELLGTDKPTEEEWINALNRAVEIQEFIRDQVYTSRKKDFDNPFRQATYRNEAEMNAAIGTIEDNEFVHQVREETEDFRKLASDAGNRN